MRRALSSFLLLTAVAFGQQVSNPGTSGGGGSGTVSPGTTNKLPKYTNGAGATVGDSLASDDGTTFLYGGSGGLSALSFTSTGTASPDVLTEQAAPTSPAATLIDYWADSTDHRVHDKSSGGTIGTTVVSDTGAANNFLTGVSAAGVISKAQPSSSNLSDGATLVKESGNLTSGVIPKASGTATVVDSLVTDDGTTLGYSGTGGITASAGPLKSASDGTHAGRVSLSGNTTAPTLPTNSFSILGPNSASFTAFAWQPPTAENGAAGLVQAGAASSHVSALTVVTALPNGMTATTQTVGDNTTKVATDAFVLANAGGTSLGTIFSWAGQSNTINTGVTQNAPLTGNGSWSTNYFTPWSPLISSTCKNLYVVTQSTQSGTGTLVVTLYFGATAGDTQHLTALTVTVAAGAAAGIYSDTTHTVAITNGYLWGYQLVNNASTASAGVAGVAMQCQ